MAKPGSLPRWADVGGAIAVPPSGVLDTGHLSNQAPLHTFENWYKNLVYQWTQALNALMTTGGGATDPLDTAGQIRGGSLVATGAATVGTTLGVTGISTLTGLLNANGGIAVPTGKAVTLNGNTTFTVGTGATALGGTLSVTDLITASNGVTAAANKNVAVSGTGKHTHGTRTILITPAAMHATNTSLTPSQRTKGFIECAATAGATINFNVELPAGARVLAIRVNVTSAVNPLNAVLYSVASNTGTVTPQLTTGNSAVGGNQQVSQSGTITITAGNTYGVEVGRASGAALFSVFGAEIDYDDP